MGGAGPRQVEAPVLARLSLKPVRPSHITVTLLDVFLADEDVPGCFHSHVNELLLLYALDQYRSSKSGSVMRTMLAAKVL